MPAISLRARITRVFRIATPSSAKACAIIDNPDIYCTQDEGSLPRFRAIDPSRDATRIRADRSRSMVKRSSAAKAAPRKARPGGQPASALLDDEVYGRIYAAIARQELPPGTRLREDQVRHIFGVSRARIRKIFSRLAYDGLVSIEPNRGASVARPSPEEARENFAARRVIETGVVAAVAGKLDGRHKAALVRHLARETAAETHRNSAEMIRLSGEFHMILAGIAGNRTLQRFLRELITRESLIILAYERPGTPSCSKHEHQLILEALGRRDAARATKLMLEHVRNVEKRLDLDRDTRRPVDLKQVLAAGRG
jgi:DNA-binding GntR family transcriptional regulator